MSRLGDAQANLRKAIEELNRLKSSGDNYQLPTLEPLYPWPVAPELMFKFEVPESLDTLRIILLLKHATFNQMEAKQALAKAAIAALVKGNRQNDKIPKAQSSCANTATKLTLWEEDPEKL